MKKRRLRLGVAIGLVGLSLMLGRPASAEDDGAPAPKCNCYIPFLGHGTWYVGPDGVACGRTDCWVPLEN